jgi:carbon-monoxide dehydrogenase large subunit
MSAYRLPSIDVEVVPRSSDTPPVAFIRGGGRPVGNFTIERMMDRLARRLGLDPIEVRRRNLIAPSDMPYETGLNSIVYDGGDYPRLLELAVERIGAASVRERQRSGEPVGVGVAMCAESTGIGMAEPSRVAVLGDGTVRVFVGSTPQGQGHQTFIAQVVADRLGWPIDKIDVHAGDSRDVAFSFVTAGSRSALEVGNSVAGVGEARSRRRRPGHHRGWGWRPWRSRSPRASGRPGRRRAGGGRDVGLEGSSGLGVQLPCGGGSH